MGSAGLGDGHGWTGRESVRTLSARSWLRSNSIRSCIWIAWMSVRGSAHMQTNHARVSSRTTAR